MSTQRAKGTRFESEVVAFLQANGFPHAERRVGHGINDKGDVTGIPGWVLEVKNTKRIDWGEFMAEAKREAANAGVRLFALVVKKRLRPVHESYAVVELHTLVELMRDAGWAPKDHDLAASLP